MNEAEVILNAILLVWLRNLVWFIDFNRNSISLTGSDGVIPCNFLLSISESLD